MTDSLNFRPLMEFCLGVLGWAPEAFWNATVAEATAAVDGWRRQNGHGTRIPDYPDAAFMEMMRARFPD